MTMRFHSQGRTEKFGEGGVQCEFDEGAGQEMTFPRGLGLSPRIFLASNNVSQGVLVSNSHADTMQ